MAKRWSSAIFISDRDFIKSHFIYPSTEKTPATICRIPELVKIAYPADNFSLKL